MQKSYLTVLLLAAVVSFATMPVVAKADDDHELADEVMKLERDMVPILLKGGSDAADWWNGTTTTTSITWAPTGIR